MEYFDAAATYIKVLENGKSKRVTEHILVNAMSFTEAEAKTIEYFSASNQNELMVKSIKYEPLSTLFESDGDKWYRCKVAFLYTDEKTGGEKKTIENMIVQAKDLTEAKKNLEEGMKDIVCDWELNTVQETSFVDLVK